MEPHVILDLLNGKLHCLTAEDAGDWGLDIGTKLPSLLGLLKCRVRIDKISGKRFDQYYEDLEPFLLSGTVDRIRISLTASDKGLGPRLRKLADARMSESGLRYTNQLDLDLSTGTTRQELKTMRFIVYEYLQDSIPFTGDSIFRHSVLNPAWICPDCGNRYFECKEYTI